MACFRNILFVISTVFLMACATAGTSSSTPATPGKAEQLLGESAQAMDSALGRVMESAQSLAKAYPGVVAATEAPDRETRRDWQATAYQVDQTLAIKTWKGKVQPPFQSPQGAIYFYDGVNLTNQAFLEIAAMSAFMDQLKTAYMEPKFSWVYFTAPDETFAIYPFLPMNKALNNDRPTDKVFYKAADIEKRACGWTEPYLDLAGAGMMVTVSCPSFDNDELMGVASRDITLGELSAASLAHLGDVSGTVSYVMTANGMAIASSDPDLKNELDYINSRAAKPMLYFRDPAKAREVGGEDAKVSTLDYVNALGEEVIRAGSAQAGDSGIIRVEREGRVALAKRSSVRDWYVVTILP